MHTYEQTYEDWNNDRVRDELTRCDQSAEALADLYHCARLNSHHVLGALSSSIWRAGVEVPEDPWRADPVSAAGRLDSHAQWEERLIAAAADHYGVDAGQALDAVQLRERIADAALATPADTLQDLLAKLGVIAHRMDAGPMSEEQGALMRLQREASALFPRALPTS